MTIEAAKPVQPCVPQAEDFFRQYDVDTFRPEPGAHCGPKPRPNMISSDELFAPPADPFAPPDLSHWGGTPAPERTAEEIFAPPTDPFAPPDLSSWGGTPAPSSPSGSCGCGGSCDGQCGAGCAGNCGGGCSSKRRAPAVQEWPPKDPDAFDVEAEWARYYAEGGRRGATEKGEYSRVVYPVVSDSLRRSDIGEVIRGGYLFQEISRQLGVVTIGDLAARALRRPLEDWDAVVGGFQKTVSGFPPVSTSEVRNWLGTMGVSRSGDLLMAYLVGSHPRRSSLVLGGGYNISCLCAAEFENYQFWGDGYCDWTKPRVHPFDPDQCATWPACWGAQPKCARTRGTCMSTSMPDNRFQLMCRCTGGDTKRRRPKNKDEVDVFELPNPRPVIDDELERFLETLMIGVAVAVVVTVVTAVVIKSCGAAAGPGKVIVYRLFSEVARRAAG